MKTKKKHTNKYSDKCMYLCFLQLYGLKKKVNSKQQFLNVIIKTTTTATKQYSNISLNSKHSRLV